jgi:integrase
METTNLLVTNLEVDTALADLAVPAAVRAVWQLLWESEVTVDEVLALDVPDAELDDHLVVVREAKGAGVFEVGVTPSAVGVLRELVGARTDGPLFQLDGRRLSKARVAAAFRAATGGRSIHALRFTRQAKERGTIRLSPVAAEARQEKTA